MSLWDDYKVDVQFAMDFPHGVNNDEWRTREGKVLKVKDMTTAHIKNCMRMIGKTDDFYYVFEAELKKRNEFGCFQYLGRIACCPYCGCKLEGDAKCGKTT